MEETRTIQNKVEKTLLSELLEKSEMLRPFLGREVKEMNITNSWGDGKPKFINIILADEEVTQDK